MKNNGCPKGTINKVRLRNLLGLYSYYFSVSHNYEIGAFLLLEFDEFFVGFLKTYLQLFL